MPPVSRRIGPRVAADPAHRHRVAAGRVLGPGVDHAVAGRGEGRVPDVAGRALAHPPRRPPTRRRASGGRRCRTGRPTRPCQHTCRLPSGWANTSWLNDGPSVSLTGSGSVHRIPSNRLAHTPTPAGGGPAEQQPRGAVRGDRRGRAEQVLGAVDHGRHPALGAGGQLGPQPVAAAFLPLQPADQQVVTVRGDAGPGRVAAALDHPDRAAGLPGQPGRGVQHGAGPGQLGRDLPVALVHPHVAQRVRVQRGHRGGDVDARRRRPGPAGG